MPNDPIMLLSFVNMKLRDFYPSLEELCKDMNADRGDIVSKLSMVGYEYSEELNKFV